MSRGRAAGIASGTNQSGGTGRVNEIIRQLRGYDGGPKLLYPLPGTPVFSQDGGGIPGEGMSVAITQTNSGSPVQTVPVAGAGPRVFLQLRWQTMP